MGIRRPKQNAPITHARRVSLQFGFDKNWSKSAEQGLRVDAKILSSYFKLLFHIFDLSAKPYQRAVAKDK